MELMRLPSISEEGDEDFTACKAHYSLWVYTMCNYLRLSLLGQKSNPDVVVLGENNEENKALIGRGWWNEQYKIKQPICPKFGEIVQTIFLYKSMSEAENNQFSRRVLGTLLRIDSPHQIQQIQLLGLTRFQCHSREFKILYGIEQNIDDMAIYMETRGYYFVPASRIVQLTPEEERKLEMISFRSIYLTVIYDSSKNKKIHSMVKKKLKNFKIDRYFWYFPTSEFSGHTGVELSSFGRLFSKENQWISDALNSFLSEIYFAKLVESGTGLRDAGNWMATLQKKLDAIHGKENFYSADQSRWKIEVFDTAKMNLVGWQSFLVTNPSDYRLMIETSFSRLGEFLAKVFKGKVEDLPEHFLHPMKALRGERIPRKWYKLPSVDTCQNVQFSNCAAYVVLSLSIERYFKSEGKSIDTEDDILYAKRAIMLRLSRLYKKKKNVSKKNTGSLPVTYRKPRSQKR